MTYLCAPFQYSCFMSSLREYIIPIKGLVKEKYRMEFELTDWFFSNFQNSPIQKADLSVSVNLEKKPTLMLFEFEVEGRIGCNCDRCLADIMLPVNSRFELMVKLDHQGDEKEGDHEFIIINAEESQFDLSPFLYEYAVLSLPMKKTYDCEMEKPKPCNEKVLERLQGKNKSEESDSGMENIWDKIKRDLKN